MKVAREDADYVAVVPDIPDTMMQQLEDANKVISILAALPAASPKVP
jgi:hypothetical protein